MFIYYTFIYLQIIYLENWNVSIMQIEKFELNNTSLK